MLKIRNITKHTRNQQTYNKAGKRMRASTSEAVYGTTFCCVVRHVEGKASRTDSARQGMRAEAQKNKQVKHTIANFGLPSGTLHASPFLVRSENSSSSFRLRSCPAPLENSAKAPRSAFQLHAESNLLFMPMPGLHLPQTTTSLAICFHSLDTYMAKIRKANEKQFHDGIIFQKFD